MYVYFICEIPSIGNIFYGLLFVKSINELKAQLTITSIKSIIKALEQGANCVQSWQQQNHGDDVTAVV